MSIDNFPQNNGVLQKYKPIKLEQLCKGVNVSAGLRFDSELIFDSSLNKKGRTVFSLLLLLLCVKP